ncbi:MAG: amidohydrolase family protein [Asgard group archaeon]|nr:amidohydrolase family protein [Asgard group archaeon]
MSSISVKKGRRMKKRFLNLLLNISLAIILVMPICFSNNNISANTEQPVEVDYIFYNANIITMDFLHPIFEAIAIDDGVIVCLGSTEAILGNFTTSPGNSLDINGLSIMPGIIDGHTHLIKSAIDGGDISLAEAQQKALTYGYTTLNEKSADTWANNTQMLLDAEAADELILRLNVFPAYNLPILDENNETIIVENWYPTREPILDHTRKFRVPGIKIFTDGAYGNRGIPAMTVPYTPELLAIYQSSSIYGDLYFNQTELNEIVDTIHDKGFSCAFHAMGDRAIEEVMNAIEYALNGTADDIARHQIEHNSMIRDDLITKAITLGTIHSVRGYFPTYWQDEDETLYNSTILGWYANRYSLPGLGIHAYLETDFAWEGYEENDVTWTRNINPFLHLWGLVTRKAIDENGIIHEPHPWLAENEISAQMALRMMTIEGAYAVKQEDYLGSIEIGKFADLIVLTNDPENCDVDDLKDIEVLLTMIDGEIEYQREDYTPTPTTPISSTHIFNFAKTFITIPIILCLIIFLRIVRLRNRITTKQ